MKKYVFKRLKIKQVIPIPRLRRVNIRIYNICWLNEQEQLCQFYKYMSRTQNHKYISNELIYALLVDQRYTGQLLWVFGAFLVKAFLIIFHHFYIIVSYEEKLWYYAVRLPIICLTFFELYSEMRQLLRNKIFKYLADSTNLLQNFTNLLNSAIVLWRMARVAPKNLMLISALPSIGCFFMIVQVIYWMTLFEQTSFYVTIVTESIWEIRYFLFMVFVSCWSFANALTILNHNQIEHEIFKAEQGSYDEPSGYLEEHDEHAFDIGFIDNFIVQYLIGLGEFQIDEFSGNPQSKLLWFYFILATMITQVIFMNTLIAILGDTYERIMDKKEQYAIMQRTKIYADHLSNIKLSVKMTSKDFLFMVKPVEGEIFDDQDEVWVSAVSQLKQRISRSQDSIKMMFQQKTDEVQMLQGKLINESSQELRSLIEKNVVNQSGQIKSNISDIYDKIQEIDGQLSKTHQSNQVNGQRLDQMSSQIQQMDGSIKAMESKINLLVDKLL